MGIFGGLNAPNVCRMFVRVRVFSLWQTLSKEEYSLINTQQHKLFSGSSLKFFNSKGCIVYCNLTRMQLLIGVPITIHVKRVAAHMWPAKCQAASCSPVSRKMSSG